MKETIYCYNIPETYNVSQEIYLSLLQQLIENLEELNIEFKNNNEKTWTNFIFIIDRNGKFNIKYHYNDTLNSKFTMMERQIIFEYEVVGLEMNNEDKEVIDCYINSDEYRMYLED